MHMAFPNIYVAWAERTHPCTSLGRCGVVHMFCSMLVLGWSGWCDGLCSSLLQYIMCIFYYSMVGMLSSGHRMEDTLSVWRHSC